MTEADEKVARNERLKLSATFLNNIAAPSSRPASSRLSS